MALHSGRTDRGQQLIRRVVSLSVVALAVGLTAIWLLAPPERLPARLVASDCTVVPVVDPRTGDEIVGAEAMALSPDGERLYFSAYDRRDGPDASGGVYTVSAFELGAWQRMEALSLYNPKPGEVFRPHGLAVSPNGRRLALINRSMSGTAEVWIGDLEGRDLAGTSVVRSPDLCRANGLEFDLDGSLSVTLDRMDCSLSFRDIMPGARTGRLGRIEDGRLAILSGGFEFPNGIARGYLAETRGMRISGNAIVPIRLPGGPDNLWMSQEGKLITALHPRLHLLGLYLRGWRATAPSRIVAVDPVTREYQVVFDDPAGELFSAATSAVIAGDLLIAGSVGDRGLLVCRGAG